MQNSLLSFTLVSVMFISFSCRKNEAVESSVIISNENRNEVSSTSEKQSKNDDAVLKIGNIESGKEGVCLRIQNSKLTNGELVQIAFMEKEPTVLQAEIAEKSACKEVGFGNLDQTNITEYILKSNDNNFLNRGFGFGVVGVPEKLKVDGKSVSTDINGDGKLEYFRECTSNEGLHLTVWSGKPLLGKRIWHSYYDFSYDTVPNCDEKDYENLN